MKTIYMKIMRYALSIVYVLEISGMTGVPKRTETYADMLAYELRKRLEPIKQEVVEKLGYKRDLEEKLIAKIQGELEIANRNAEPILQGKSLDQYYAPYYAQSPESEQMTQEEYKRLSDLNSAWWNATEKVKQMKEGSWVHGGVPFFKQSAKAELEKIEQEREPLRKKQDEENRIEKILSAKKGLQSALEKHTALFNQLDEHVNNPEQYIQNLEKEILIAGNTPEQNRNYEKNYSDELEYYRERMLLNPEPWKDFSIIAYGILPHNDYWFAEHIKQKLETANEEFAKELGWYNGQASNLAYLLGIWPRPAMYSGLTLTKDLPPKPLGAFQRFTQNTIPTYQQQLKEEQTPEAQWYRQGAFGEGAYDMHGEYQGTDRPGNALKSWWNAAVQPRVEAAKQYGKDLWSKINTQTPAEQAEAREFEAHRRGELVDPQAFKRGDWGTTYEKQKKETRDNFSARLNQAEKEKNLYYPTSGPELWARRFLSYMPRVKEYEENPIDRLFTKTKKTIPEGYKWIRGKPTSAEINEESRFYAARNPGRNPGAVRYDYHPMESNAENERAASGYAKIAGEERIALYALSKKDLWRKRFGLLEEKNIPTEPLGQWRSMTNDELSTRQDLLAAERFAARVEKYGNEYAVNQERGITDGDPFAAAVAPYTIRAFNEEYEQQQRPHLKPRNFAEWKQWLWNRKPGEQSRWAKPVSDYRTYMSTTGS
jgi:hypothetical protein